MMWAKTAWSSLEGRLGLGSLNYLIGGSYVIFTERREGPDEIQCRWGTAASTKRSSKVIHHEILDPSFNIDTTEMIVYVCRR